MANLLLINTRVLAGVELVSGDELCTNLPNENTINFVGFLSAGLVFIACLLKS